ncbi:MAG: hypothetical protein WC313_03705 [Candidatus Kapaibacterium sp.]
MKNMNIENVVNYVRYFIVSFAGLFLFVACNDKPSDLAVNLLPDTVAVRSVSSYDTLLITGKTVYAPKMPIFNNGSILIGKFGELNAVSVINFAFLPDTLGSLTESEIQSVEMTMFPDRYAFGDTVSGNYGFDIYKVVRRWVPDSTTHDSLMISPANYFAQEKIMRWENRIDLKDSIDPVKITLPKDLIIEWLKTEEVLDTVSNTMKPRRIPNWGIAFVPTENTSVIHRFEAAAPSKTMSTEILVKYKTAADTADRELNLVSGVDVTFLKDTEPDTSDIVIQNGLNYWTRFDFDVTSIPRYSGIHKAQFELTLDPERTRQGNVGLDSVVEFGYFVDGEQVSTFNYTGGRQAESDKYLFPSLTSIIQYMNKYSGKFSLVLMPHSLNNQARELERLTFFGLNHSDSTKRPVLKIVYSLNPAYLEPK